MTVALLSFAAVAVVAALALLFVSPSVPTPPPVIIPSPGPPVPSPIEPAKPSTVDAVVAWETVRARLLANQITPDKIQALDDSIAPNLFNRQ